MVTFVVVASVITLSWPVPTALGIVLTAVEFLALIGHPPRLQKPWYMQPEIGASSVTERVAESRLAKRTRTVTVRPGLDLARSRVPIRSARRSEEHTSELQSR